jgi:hypothetical protein
MNTSSQDMGKVDLAAAFRIESYGGIPFVWVDGLTSTTILLCDRTDVKVYHWLAVDIQPKDVYEYATAGIMVVGANVVVHDPRHHAKLTGVTA